MVYKTLHTMEELIEALQDIQMTENIEQAHLIADAALFKLRAKNETDLFDVDDYLNSTETI